MNEGGSRVGVQLAVNELSDEMLGHRAQIFVGCATFGRVRHAEGHCSTRRSGGAEPLPWVYRAPLPTSPSSPSAETSGKFGPQGELSG
jgi:hypothetical protein